MSCFQREVVKTAAKRKPISKRIRFEVFKRDKFTCQYCGWMAPDVILEVDHIKPVANGGNNDLLNLITSCRDCNRGKGKREISDDSVIKKQQAALKDLADRNEQLEMMVQWKDELLKVEQRSVELLCDYLNDTFCVTVNESGKLKLRKWLKKYSVEELIQSIDEAFSNTFCENLETAFAEIPKYAYYNKHPVSPDKRQVMYLRKILINRLGCDEELKRNLYLVLHKFLFDYHVPFNAIKDACCSCNDWTELAYKLKDLKKHESDQ